MTILQRTRTVKITVEKQVKGKDTRREWGEGGTNRSHSSSIESGPNSVGNGGSSSSSSNKQQQQKWTSPGCKVEANNRISSTPTDTDRPFLWQWQNVEILALTSILWSGMKWPITAKDVNCIVTRKKEALPSKNHKCREQHNVHTDDSTDSWRQFTETAERVQR